MHLADAINGMLKGKTVYCNNSRKSQYIIQHGVLCAKDQDVDIYHSACITGDVLRQACEVRYPGETISASFEDDMVQIPKEELKALRTRLDQLEKGGK